MANKVDVFTEELSKVFTILQQQYVMIKYMKALITSGELDETEINKLKEQISLINTNIDNIENALFRHTEEINNNTATINALNNVMPTDINMDSDGNLILEHDGKEITGQKKQVAVYTKKQIDTLLNSTGLKTFNLNYPFTYMYPTDNHAERTITNATQIPIVYECIQYVKEHGACILKIRNGMYSSSGYTDYNPVYVLCITSPDSDNSILECYGTTGEHIIKLISDNDTSLGSESNTKIIYDKIAKASGDTQLFRHMITIYANGSSLGFIFEYISDNNLNVNSIQDLNTITHASKDTSILCSVLNAGQNFSLNLNANGIRFDGTNWYYGFIIEGTIFSETLLSNIDSISDIVTTI